MHQHKYQPTANSTETCDCGAMRVVVDAATQARRDAATVAYKVRVNAEYRKAR